MMEKNKKSELLQLLEKNAYGPGLTEKERDRAIKLIANPVFSEDDCWICKMSHPQDVSKSIFDLRVCQYHAYYALITRKL